MSSQRLTFPDEEFSLAIHGTVMFTVKEINRFKILQDVIERNLRSSQAAEILGINATSLQPSTEMLSPVWAAWYEQPESRSHW